MKQGWIPVLFILFALFVLSACTAVSSPTVAPTPTNEAVGIPPTNAPTPEPTETPGPPPPTEDLSANIPDPCTLLTGDEINTVLDKTLQQAAPEPDPFKLKDVPGFANSMELVPLQFAKRCVFTLNDQAGGTPNPRVVLTLIPGRTSLDLERAQAAKPSLQNVDGVADSALWAADILELEFIKGTNDLKLLVVDEAIGPSTDAAHKLDQAKQLAAKIIPRLP
ncbi:MAG: hypothetical protein ACM3JD_08070 [Rudaea sp.]